VIEVAIQTAAKINLGLRVLGRRSDGYHEVETVLHTIGLWDRIRLQPTTDGLIEAHSEDQGVPRGEDNLCWQSAALLADHTNTKAGAIIHIEKGIPIRSGLGGGSSDAAATLAGLTRLWDISIAPDDLETIAAEIGADVPFFLRGGCCLARGKGERLASHPEFEAWLIVVVPELRISTAQAYASLQRGVTRGRRRAPSRPIQRLLKALETRSPREIAKAIRNDFESAKIAGVAEALSTKEELLAEGCLGALMSGSGSAVFGIAPNRTKAEQVAASLKRTRSWVKAVPTVGAEKSMDITLVETD